MHKSLNPPATAGSSHTENPSQFRPLPRARRRPRRAKVDRGLPPDEQLTELAKTFLELQRKLWPEFAKAEILPEPHAAAVVQMVEDFKHRHRTGEVDFQRLRDRVPSAIRLAGNYNRFSCENSSPRSIIDQMANALRKAREESRFVPWDFVFCDYSQSGLHASRQGYSSYKKVLSHERTVVETTYIDDFTRASRDELEWWRLAAQSKRLGKRMIGASDGFDLSSQMWEVQIMVYGLTSRLFVKSLREKVRRGMRGAASRGTCLGMPSLGFTRAPASDDEGRPRLNTDGTPVFELCADPETAPFRRLMFELFVEKCWSTYKITKHFNALEVDGWGGWTEPAIRRLLWSPTSIGVFIWNRTRREYDHEEEKNVTVENPRSEWQVYYDPKKAIVTIDLYRAARRKLAAASFKNPRNGKRMSRNQKSATTLFSGTLQCGYCGRELILNRSAGKYKVMGCLNGPNSAHGCQLSTTKSTRILEICLLGFLRDRLLTEESVNELVAKGNAYLKKEAARPRMDTAPLKKRVRACEKAIDQLFLGVEGADNAAIRKAYDKRIESRQTELQELKRQIRQIEAQDAPPPPPLNAETVRACL